MTQPQNDIKHDLEAQEGLRLLDYEASSVPQNTAKGIWTRIKAAARELKKNVTILWYASADPRTPTSAKFLAYVVLGVALSPIDLIPDFIPIIGMLDDIIIVPLSIWLAIKLMYVFPCLSNL